MTIAIIAHDGKKVELIQFLNNQKDFILNNNIKLYSTGTTGKKATKAGFEVNKLESGPLGGDAQIAAMVVEKEIDMILFFRDPLEKHPHEPDIFMLMRLCDVYDVPLATNPATANLLFDGLKSKSEFK